MDTLEHLRAIPLFRELSDADLALIEPQIRSVQYEAGAVVCRQGEMGVALYMVESGELQVSHVDARGVARDLDVLQSPHFFGENAMLFGEPYPTSITVRSPALLRVLSHEDLSRLLNEQRELCAHLTRAMKPAFRTRFAQSRLPWLLQGEVPIVFIRKHWWAIVRNLPLPVGLTVMAIAIAIAITALGLGVITTAVTWGIAMLVVSLIYVIVTLDWRNDLYIVTNRRVIHIERILLVREERNEAPMEKIQNVELRQPRYLHKVIGVSDLVVATASLRGAIVFSAISNGIEIRETIFEQMQRTRAQHQFEEHEQLKQRIRNQINPPPPPPPPDTASPSSATAFKPVRPPRRPLRQAIGDLLKLRIESSGTVTWRKHVFALVRQIWRPLVGFLFLLTILGLGLIGILPSSLPIALLLGVLMLGMLGWTIWEWLDWSNDIYRVTQDRLLDLELTPLGVTKKSIAAPLVAITNVSVRQPNLLTLILNIGDVVIETAGATGQLIFISVSKPREVAKEIMQYVDNTRARQMQTQREQQRADLLQWFGAYHSILQDDGVAQPTNTSTPPPDAGASNPQPGS